MDREGRGKRREKRKVDREEREYRRLRKGKGKRRETGYRREEWGEGFNDYPHS